jgi:hypothetical protein
MTEIRELIAHLENGGKADPNGLMVVVSRHAVTEAIRLLNLLGETNEALAACQSEGSAWKRLAEERAWKIDDHEYVLSQRGEKTLYWAAIAVANAIQIGAGGMIRGTAIEEDLRNALMLGEGELRNVPKGSTVRTTVTATGVPSGLTKCAKCGWNHETEDACP